LFIVNQQHPNFPYLQLVRRFLKNSAFFALPFLALLIWMSTDGNYDKQYAYRQVQKDCRSGDWMYRRMFESDLPIEVAFIGTSKTMCDVNDSLLQRRLREEHGIRTHIANLGVCRTGENLHYLIARDLIQQKQPKIVLAEISTHIAANSHFHFPMVANATDVLFPTLVFNDDLLHDMNAFAWNRLIYHRERALGIDRHYEDILHNPEHSFMQVANDVVADSAEMERIKKVRHKKLLSESPSGIPGLVNALSTNYPKQYLRRIYDLCQANGTELYFLYLPVYGVPGDRPRDEAFYTKMAPILTPPDSIFRNPKLHFDYSHLNQRGAALFSDWLVEKLTEIIPSNPG
jgi:hypothetical protein